jgi:hypothetical protein
MSFHPREGPGKVAEATAPVEALPGRNVAEIRFPVKTKRLWGTDTAGTSLKAAITAAAVQE